MKNKIKTWNKTDLKVFILCLLDEFQHPMNYTDILDTVMDVGAQAGFDFQECFEELKDDGHILSDKIDMDTYYMISSTGSLVAKELRNSIPEDLLNRSTIAAAKHLELEKLGIGITTKITPLDEGRYEVLFTIVENEKSDLMNLKLNVSSLDTAKQMQKYIESTKAENVYKAILSIVTGKIDYLI